MPVADVRQTNQEMSLMSATDPTSTDATAEQGRIFERKDYEAEIELSQQSDHNFYTGFTENISSGGLFVATRDLKPIGTKMEISFSIPGYDKKITTQCEVRWQRLEQPHVDSNPGIGVRFTDLDPASAKAINDFIGTRASLFYDDE